MSNTIPEGSAFVENKSGVKILEIKSREHRA